MYKMMIVDDEPMTRNYIKARVSELHPEWICAGEASDGQEALELLAGGENHYDLIITDIKMPIMSGIELARELASRSNPPRIVILSGYDEFALAKEAITYGVHEYMLKPLVNEELADTLERMARELAAERIAQAAYRSLSEQSKELTVRNFLRAVVADNNMELKVLYPLLYRLKINLIEAEGAIMLVHLEEKQLKERNLSSNDRALYRYVVHQTTAELIDPASGILLFVDQEERTAMLVTGEDADDVQVRCGKLFDPLTKAVHEMTGLTLWGAVGSPAMDVLQLGASYRAANSKLLHRSLAGEPRLLTGNGPCDEAPEPAGVIRDNEHEIVVKVKAYIFAHYAEPISLALIADTFGLSPGYLSSLFHQNTGQSYIKFLTSVRMERAAEWLRVRPSEKVYDVAEKVGYLSVKHFSYVFKQHFGMPPGEYQDKHTT